MFRDVPLKTIPFYPFFKSSKITTKTTPFVYPVYQFKNIIEKYKERPGKLQYRESPLNQFNTSIIGTVCQDIIMLYNKNYQNYETRKPNTNECGKTMTGKCRSLSNSEFDYMRNGKRIEVKTGKLVWDTNLFRIRFRHITKTYFDILVLIFYMPDGLYIWEIDNKDVVVSSKEKAMCFYGKKYEKKITLAYRSIVQKSQKKNFTCYSIKNATICEILENDDFNVKCS